MKYKIVTSGETKVVTLNELSQNLKPSSEIYALSDVDVYLGPVSHKTRILFATEFVEYAIKNYAKIKLPEAEFCIHLIRRWLEDDSSVSNKKLRAAADAARNAAYASYGRTTDPTHSAADAAHSAHSAASAASAAYATADYPYAATYASANAITYAAYAAGADREKEFIRQGEFIIDFLKSGKHLFLV